MIMGFGTHLLANAGKATGLAVLVHWLGDPVDPGIPADLYTRNESTNTLILYKLLTALWLGSTRITS